MVNNPELINKMINNLNKLDDETIKEAIREVESEDMELEVDKKEFERIQQELIQATAENITLEYFEYEGKKWLNEDFVIPISVIQNKLEQNKAKTDCRYCNNACDSYAVCTVLQELLEERR